MSGTVDPVGRSGASGLGGLEATVPHIGRTA